ncbi:sulfatase-like hydrolase/transferase [Novosphingobium sp. P6W]|uniref:sulfatase-like hydrolase/transferase n=1 Tax=Novosphingobium sp. P6W TaxID=1609758 RepID=UPI000696E7A6|nr:sulfatase-like hydrolase/transferase [Novosphingobium sp. P6W]AXB75856.1 arylsulfatase [Novosphingobium sp. P6W]
MRIIRRTMAALALSSMLAGASVPAVAAETAPAATAAPRTSGPPNIILILADDFGVEGINAYGGEYHTPNVDRLASEGTRFDNAHAMPLCSPSRVRLMTGQENWRNYEAFGYLAPGQRTFGNVMKDAGYVTGMFGKWQLMGNGFDGRTGITPKAAGFDESYLWQLQALTPKGSRYWGPTRAYNGTPKISEEGFGPDFDSAKALDFIAKNKKKPFFLYYPMVLVHNPWVQTPDSMTAEGARDRFNGMVSYMDRLVGDLMAKLKAEGLDQNTVVIFTGDNGTNRQITSMRNGHPVRGGKGTTTINGTHVPFIAWGPGVPQGKVSEALVDFTDLLPTFADIAGKPALAGKIDGVSQWPVIGGKAQSARSSIFMHYAPVWQFQPERFAFDANWKLYGDGRFVAMDPIAGVETEVPAGQRKGEAARHYAALREVMDETQDGPLDPTRYPWCEGQPSLDAAKPATVAGCSRFPGGEE